GGAPVGFDACCMPGEHATIASKVPAMEREREPELDVIAFPSKIQPQRDGRRAGTIHVILPGRLWLRVAPQPTRRRSFVSSGVLSVLVSERKELATCAVHGGVKARHRA